jgi:hypothetical protein
MDAHSHNRGKKTGRTCARARGWINTLIWCLKEFHPDEEKQGHSRDWNKETRRGASHGYTIREG